MKRFLVIFVLLVSVLSIVGCNLFGNNDDDNNYVGPVTVNAPANAKAFNGVKLSFNPTITFTSDGTTNTFTYVNNAADTGSIFPDAGASTLSGTFSYAPVDATKNKRRLTFAFTDTTKNFNLQLTNFTGTSAGISGVEITKEGDSTGKVFAAQVEGNLTPEATPADDKTPTDDKTSGVSDIVLPDAVKGKILSLVFMHKQESVPTDFPYNEGDSREFTFSESGKLFVGIKGETTSREMGEPKKYSGSEEIVWFDAKYNIFYALSILPDGVFNEINAIGDPSKKPVGYYGQFKL